MAHNQDYLIENANIVLRNGIDKTYTKQIGMKLDSYATQLAVKLKKYAYRYFFIIVLVLQVPLTAVL